MRIVELESRVKEIYEIDKTSSELYLAIRELVEHILVTRGKTFNYIESDEVSHEIAASLYLQVNEGREIHAWSKYILIISNRYIEEYLDVNKKEIIELDDPVDYYQSSLIHQGRYEISEIDKYGKDDILSSIPFIIQETIEEVSRFDVGTYNYRNLELSVKLSIYHSTTITVDEDLIPEKLVEFVVSVIIERVSSYIRYCVSSNNHVEDISDKVIRHNKYHEYDWNYS